MSGFVVLSQQPRWTDQDEDNSRALEMLTDLGGKGITLLDPLLVEEHTCLAERSNDRVAEELRFRATVPDAVANECERFQRGCGLRTTKPDIAGSRIPPCSTVSSISLSG